MVTVAKPTDAAPTATPETATRMSRQRRRDTTPEVLLRRALHSRGLRFRVDSPLPGLPRRRADVLFTRARVAVFVDGCFWHRCPVHGTWPASNAAWWKAKLERNVERDRETDQWLADAGWATIRVWEHEESSQAADRIDSLVRTRKTDRKPRPPAGLGGTIDLRRPS